MKLSGICIFTWWPFFAFCGADVVHMWYYTMTGVLTVGKLAQSFVSVAKRNNVPKRQPDRSRTQRIYFTLSPQNNRLKEGLLCRQSLLFFTLQKPSLLLWRLDKVCHWISIAQGDRKDKSWKFIHHLLQANICQHWLFQQLLSIWKAPLSACGAEVMAFKQTTPVKM